MRRHGHAVRKASAIPAEFIAMIRRIHKPKSEAETLRLARREWAASLRIEKAARGIGGKFPHFKPLR